MVATYVDSHCHVSMSEGTDETLARARKAGVHGFLVPGTKLDDASEVVAIANVQLFKLDPTATDR